MVTGKNKEQFKMWYYTYYGELTTDDFNNLHFELQLGVYLAYCDCKGYRINVENFMDTPDYFRFKINGSYIYDKEALSTLQQAYKEAFKQADKLMNRPNDY